MDEPDWDKWDRDLHLGDPETARAWQDLLQSRLGESTGHGRAARICESKGLAGLAMREWQLVLRFKPRDKDAVRHLANLHLEKGENERAAELLESLLEHPPLLESDLLTLAGILQDEDDAQRLARVIARAERLGLVIPPARLPGRQQDPRAGDGANHPARGEFHFTDADCSRLCALFAGREDHHARQWVGDGGVTGYTPVQEPFSPRVARNHLAGTCTVGIYPIRLDGTCTFMALDLDITKAALSRAQRDRARAAELRSTLRSTSLIILGRLRSLGLQPLFEHSGYKGRHYWIFLDQPEASSSLHHFGRDLLAWLAPAIGPDFHLEFFPKQGATKGKGLGNLIKVPLGIHRRTGHRANLLDDVGEPLDQPFRALSATHMHPRELIASAAGRLRGSQRKMEGGDEPRQEPDTPSLPAPARVEVGWTSADFETDREVAHLLACCPVLQKLRERAEDDRTLTHDEQLILIHTMGHLQSGPAAVNHLLEKCIGVGSEKLMKDRHKGSPTSCPSIRKRIPLITRGCRCNCDFSFAPDRYPTPLLHMVRLPADAKLTGSDSPVTARTPESLAAALLACIRKGREMAEEEERLREALVAILRNLPGRSVSTAGFTCTLLEHDGVEEIAWEGTEQGGGQGAG